MSECNKNLKSMAKYGNSFKAIDEQLNSQRSEFNNINNNNNHSGEKNLNQFLVSSDRHDPFEI